jgi:hypothetical protein
MDRAATVIHKTRDYLHCPAVVGFEAPFFRLLEQEFQALGCATERTAKVLSVWRDPTATAMLSVHIDRHGLVATGGGEHEYAAFIARLSPEQPDYPVACAMLQRIQDRFLGETGRAYRPADGAALGEGPVESSYFCDQRHNLVFRVPGLETLPVGTPVALRPPPPQATGGLCGQLDNAVSAAVVHTLFAAGFAGRALFTAEEEIGRSWQHALEYLQSRGLSTTALLVLDTSPFPEPAAVEEGWVVLRNRDANGIFNADLVARLRQECQRLGIPYRLKDEWIEEENRRREARGEDPMSLGSTELGRLVAGSKGRITGATVQIPTLGYHSNRESTTALALDHLMGLLGAVLLEDAR